MPLIYQKIIKREDLKRNPKVLYVFGDNVQRRGLGGQAAEMRGEPNAIGIATKWAPERDQGAYFSDDLIEDITIHLQRDLGVVHRALRQGRTVIWPADGIGTGLSQLPERAPKVWALLENGRRQLEQL